ncbi:hypothetical protein WEU38_12660 [Cyanobacterium aponinum AL20118]|uniref:Myosin heavy chain n=1 Tax=Cyanobacterium aponinum AL20115 TaxID=3090662 RepID=A0AAF0ZC92_9CHRO|nr:hypothetical protein [Cyanobacterium aponinum]WPF87658.1 hypothetical protein SAY89_12725 [Cyanobacterium aponinum AL20115]
MSQAELQPTKVQIMSAFHRLLNQYQQQEAKITTKEEAIEKEKNKVLLTKVADYTVNNIVNSMATLQLDFGNLTKEIATRLENESNILIDLKKAITVEAKRLEELKQIRLVADGLYILRQEHQEKLKLLENQIEESKKLIEIQQEKLRKNWEKEQAEFEIKIAEESKLLEEVRAKEEADYNYNLQISRKREMDEYEETKRNQERELNLLGKEKNKLWQERENILASQEEEFKANQEKIAQLEEQIKTEVNKARSEAIQEADREAKVKANLVEKEWEATKQGYEFKIQSLEAKIAQQNQQIDAIALQLQNATNQAQSLALKAFQSNNN